MWLADQKCNPRRAGKVKTTGAIKREEFHASAETTMPAIANPMPGSEYQQKVPIKQVLRSYNTRVNYQLLLLSLIYLYVIYLLTQRFGN